MLLGCISFKLEIDRHSGFILSNVFVYTRSLSDTVVC